MNLIKLDNGEVLFNDHGKYRSGLTFIGKEEFFRTKSKNVTDIYSECFDEVIKTYLDKIHSCDRSLYVSNIDGYEFEITNIGKLNQFNFGRFTIEYGNGFVHELTVEYHKDIACNVKLLQDQGKFKFELLVSALKGFSCLSTILDYLVNDEFLPTKQFTEFSYMFNEYHRKQFNLNTQSPTLYGLKGDYFVSKKGTNCFRLNDEGKHIVLYEEWGGAFDTNRGGNLIRENNAVYSLVKTSNGGGMGADWVVYPVDYVRKISLDDI